jgi:excisionase family DNA binding protein
MGDEQHRLLLRIPEAAWRLGLSRSTVYELIADGQLGVIRVGRAVRVPVSELTAWLERQQREGGRTPVEA